MIGGKLNPNPSISLSTNGIDSSAISLVASATGNPLGGSIIANTSGVNISHGTEGNQGLASITNKAINLSVGIPDVGPSITITPESIIFKVGETSWTMTAAGIVTTSPAVEVNCEDTNVVISAEGISEEVAEITREVTAEGHNMMAAEVEVNIGVAGINNEAPMANHENEATTEIISSLLNETIDAIVAIDAALNESV